MQKKYIFYISILIVFIALLCSECINTSRVRKQLNILEESINNISESAGIINEGLRQQESIIEELRKSQRELEQSINGIESTVQDTRDELSKLTSSESAVDGDIGAIIGTAYNLSEGIDLTLRGIQQEGITQ